KMAKAAIDEPHITAHRDGPLSTSDKSIKIMQRRAISGPVPVEFAHIETSKVCAMRLDICFAHQAVHEGWRVLFHLQYEDLRQQTRKAQRIDLRTLGDSIFRSALFPMRPEFTQGGIAKLARGNGRRAVLHAPIFF